LKKIEIIKNAWLEAYQEMAQMKPFQLIKNGDLTKEHYIAILRQIFYQVREHPQALAMMTVRFRGDQREMVNTILRHAVSEVGHDKLALKDMEVLGVDTSEIPSERPLPSTSAILGFMHSLLNYHNPISFLGYLFHLEFLPTYAGEIYVDALLKAGIPLNATTFIQDHAEIDVAHNKLMEKYIGEMVHTEDDLESVIYAAKATAILYGRMLEEAIDSVGKEPKEKYGLNRAEN
jgi:pyrroloquinoline quinone (PQQ) biosynthesis protein C